MRNVTDDFAHEQNTRLTQGAAGPSLAAQGGAAVVGAAGGVVTQRPMHESKTVQLRPKAAPRREHDAIALLTDEHRQVKRMFAEVRKLGHDDSDRVAKAVLVGRICIALRIHTQVEQEIFYPSVRAAIHDDELMDEADVEHAGFLNLIAKLEGMDPADDRYDVKVSVLRENFELHAREEQDWMFPKARKAGVDLIGVGQRILRRSSELRAAPSC